MRTGCIRLVLFTILFQSSFGDQWTIVDQILQAAIADGAFPGCVALVANTDGILYKKSFGNFTYGIPPPFNQGQNPPMTEATHFDMASCTKVTATTTSIAQFYQRGELDLETYVYEILGQQYANNGKEAIKIIHLLTHSAGYPGDPDPEYWDPAFGCPETNKREPLENFSCQKQIYSSLMTQTLEYPVNHRYVYSDLSMITLMYVIGKLARDLGYITPSQLLPSCVQDIKQPYTDQCYYEAYTRIDVFEPLGMMDSGFLLPQQLWDMAAPTENDTDYLNRVIQGQVSDGNAYALGGIAGHAGLFSTLDDLYTFMTRYMWPLETDNQFINATTISFFIKEYNHTQSSRALGWNTNDPTVFDRGWGLLCGNMSANTFMHTGYTGTELCGDPDRQLFTILLTNRVYPFGDNMKIEDVRRHFNSAIVAITDRMKSERVQDK